MYHIHAQLCGARAYNNTIAAASTYAYYYSVVQHQRKYPNGRDTCHTLCQNMYPSQLARRRASRDLPRQYHPASSTSANIITSKRSRLNILVDVRKSVTVVAYVLSTACHIERVPNTHTSAMKDKIDWTINSVPSIN
mmetsp:Transcript_16023/g.30421  ORF Transcript_16023/g.30421 Transcript_16023/m.30421 type:complete len:137 (+) Transcript_16023:249-659(+)